MSASGVRRIKQSTEGKRLKFSTTFPRANRLNSQERMSCESRQIGLRGCPWSVLKSLFLDILADLRRRRNLSREIRASRFSRSGSYCRKHCHVML